MLVGMAGAHRAGKTTLAKDAAERLAFHYHDASVSKIMRECGINGVADLPMAERIKVQQFILDKFIEGIKTAPRPAICDRTPLDMIGYMLGEVTMHNTAPEFHEEIQNYVERCLEEAGQYFDMILIVRPLPIYVVDPKSPPPNVAYQALVQYLIEGAAQNVPYLCSGVVLSSNRDARTEAVIDVITDHIASIAEESACFTKH